MSKFQEDMIFKNISEEEIQILLEIVGKESENVNIWTKELRQIDPTTYKPDLIIELDDQNLIIEFQSTEVDDDFSRRAHVYVAITDQKKENDKEVNLEVISTAEQSKQINYKVNKYNTFTYDIIGFEEYDGEKIIKHVEKKIEDEKEVSSEESIYLSLVPLMDKNKNHNIEKQIKQVVDMLVESNKNNSSENTLSLGIMWLLVDKYVKTPELRTLLIDLLGDRMSAIYEYGERKEKKGKEEGIKEGIEEGRKEGIEEGEKTIVLNLYDSKMTPQEISKKAKIDLKKVKKIINEQD